MAITGSTTFPANANAHYTAVETLCEQNIRNLKSTNRIADGFKEYPIDGNGKVIEEAVIEMATARNFVNTGNPDLSPLDPALHIRYFSEWETKQFKVTTRRDDIRAVLMKDKGEEELASKIIDTLSQGEGHYDYTKMRDAMKNSLVGVDASTSIFGTTDTPKVPASVKGAIYCLREMYNVVKATNTLGTALDNVPQGVMQEDIRIAISESDLNLFDIVELAQIFNLTKEELFGKLVVIPADSEWTAGRVMVYDVKALGRGTRVYDYSQDEIGAGRYLNSYLTTERQYFYNNMFKCFYLDCSSAFATARASLLQ